MTTTATLHAGSLEALGAPGFVAVPVAIDGDGFVLPGGLPDSIGGVSIPRSLDAPWARAQGFEAKPGQTLVVRAVGAPSLVLIGTGQRGDDDHEVWRRLGAVAARAATKADALAIVVPANASTTAVDAARAAGEGALIASHRDSQAKTHDDDRHLEITLAVAGDAAGRGGLDDAVRAASTTASAVGWARTQINRPAAQLTPTALADEAVRLLADAPRTSVVVWDEGEIALGQMGGLLGVSTGSLEPPRLVVATYAPEAATRHIALVGKGITFDSGGLSLKSGEGMMAMKTDMSGAAIVLGAVSAAARLGVRAKVTAIAPITENLPGNRAVKPGDVLTARNGTTIEVLNTDAEGRLVLADGLSLAVELAPHAIIDVATLTGAARTALGTDVAAIFGTDPGLVAELRACGDAAGERFWELPLVDSYSSHLDSEVADLKNIGKPGNAGTIVAALFLRRFAGDVAWAHLDIAATGRAESDDGYLSKGGTAFSLRTIVEYLERA